ncbi:hypothetical protein TD95_005153 [Thielaviopsis punctulata]|uniref:Uncharacterized protein n=1 Tax=Thielaviopsis punctulata TaxID=72032 RepID=A0A0F4ZFL3_9PEZI|nr:hypothetical protein TD95_005153 [Thielaviopsis punctulata]
MTTKPKRWQLKTPDAEDLPELKRRAGDVTGPRLQGKVAIITGIGRATARLFAESGCRAVYICDRQNTHMVQQQAELARLTPDVDVHVHEFDAADEDAVRDVVEAAVRRYGRLDVFFANAGIVGRESGMGEVDGRDFSEVMRVNAQSVFLAAKYATAAMKLTSPTKPTSGGSFIATASVAGLRANAGPSAYSASKAAVISLVQTSAFQLSGTGVRANAVCPGLIETDITQPLFAAARNRGTEGKLGQLNPLGRAAVADEVARVVVFLASDESGYVNGQAWAVDGGLSAGLPFIRGKLA